MISSCGLHIHPNDVMCYLTPSPIFFMVDDHVLFYVIALLFAQICYVCNRNI